MSSFTHTHSYLLHIATCSLALSYTYIIRMHTHTSMHKNNSPPNRCKHIYTYKAAVTLADL